MNSNIVKIGDGELVLERATAYDPTNDTHISIKEAKEFHNWSNNIVQTGNYITVGVIDLFDDSPPHDDLPDSTIIERVSCTGTGCSDISTSTLPFDNHFNLVVGILAGSGLGNSDMQGLTHDSKIRFAIVDNTEHLVKALDYLVGKNVDVINMSASRKVTTCNDSYTTQQHSTSLIIDHVVKIGTPFIDSAGNRNAQNQFSLQGCGYGSIAVGNMDINGIISPTSSRGSIATPFIKPEIAALGTNIASTSIGSQYEVTSGTSFAAPLVTGTASLLLEKDRGLTSEEIRTALLLGAEFNHADLYTIPIATASLYDTDGDPDIQTYMHQFGFGKLNIQNSLDAVNSNIFPNIHRDNILSSSDTHEYRIYANSGEEVKIFMTWSIATAGSIDAVTFEGTFETALEALKNYNLKITKPDSTVILSNSIIQNKEFAYFTADQNGIYNIEVSVDGFGIPHREYVIGSNHAMDKAPFNDNFPINTDAPTCQPDEICTVTTGVTPTNRSPTLSLSPQSISANSGETVTVTASAYDPDGDTVSISWEVEQEDIDINLSISGDSTTASFVVPHDDTITSATFVIEAVATDEHNASSATQDVTINAVISESTGPISGSVFFDNFENGNLDAWAVNADWRADIFDEGTLPPDHLSGNKVAEADNCDVECVMTMSSGIDMTDNSDSAYLQFYRYVDGSLDSGEYLKIELYDGTNWVHLDTWSDDTDDDDDVWHLEKYSLSDYNSVTDFNIRFTGLMSSPVEDVGIDDVLVWTSSTVPPIFVSSPDITLTTTGLSERVFFVIPTADKGTVTCDHNQGDVFPLGTTTVTCTAVFEDVFSTTSFDVIISRTTDTTSPTITTPSDITVEATGPRTNINIGTAIATDDMDTNPTITNDAPSSFPVGVTIVTWTATDSSGNIATATQRITIQDTTSPTFTSTIPDINRTFTTGTPAVIFYDLPSARDIADPDVSVTCSPAPGSTFPAGPSTITCTATDRYGNSATSTSVVTVVFVTPTPLAPLNLAATSNIYGGFVTLSWDIPADDSVTGHRILRGLSPTSLSVLTSDTGSTTTTYTDASASPNTTYHYQVMSLNAFGASPASGTISVTTPVARLASPDNFTVSFDTTDSEIDFRWDVVDGAETYVVQRYNNDYTFVNIIHTSAVSYSLPYSGTLPYSALYMVSAISESERSIWSVPVLLEVAEPFAAVHDGFDSLGTWNLTTTTSSTPGYNNYTLSVDSQAGNPASALKVSGNGFLTFNTVTNTFDLAGLSRGDGLRLSVDMRITASSTPYPALLPEIKLFTDSHARPVASQHLDYAVNSTDGGWRTYTVDVPGNSLYTPGSLIVVFRTVDLTSDDRITTVYFDNFRLDPVAP